MSKLSLVAAATYLKFLTENRISVVCYKNDIAPVNPVDNLRKYFFNSLSSHVALIVILIPHLRKMGLKDPTCIIIHCLP